MRTNSLFLEALKDLARLLFEEFYPSLWHYLWFEHKGHRDEFIGFLLLVYDIHCHNDVFGCYLRALMSETIRLFLILSLPSRMYIIQCITLEIIF